MTQAKSSNPAAKTGKADAAEKPEKARKSEKTAKAAKAERTEAPRKSAAEVREVGKEPFANTLMPEPDESLDAARARLARALGLPYAEDPKPTFWMQELQESAAREVLFGTSSEGKADKANKASKANKENTADADGAGSAGGAGSGERNERDERDERDESAAAALSAQRGFTQTTEKPADRASVMNETEKSSTGAAFGAVQGDGLAAGQNSAPAGGAANEENAESAVDAAMSPAQGESDRLREQIEIFGGAAEAPLGGLAQARATKGLYRAEAALGEQDAFEGFPAGVAGSQEKVRVPISERILRAGRSAWRLLKTRAKRESLSRVNDQRQEKKRQNRNLLVVAAALIAAAGFVAYVSQTNQAPKKPEVKTYRNDFRLEPDSLDKQSFQRQYEEKLDALGGKMKSVESMMAQLDARLKSLAKEGKAGRGKGEAGEEEDARAALEGRLTGLARDARVASPGIPPETSLADLAGSEGERLAREAELLANLKVAGGALASSEAMRVVKVADSTVQKEAGKSQRRVPRNADLPIAANRARHEPEKTYLPAGSFARAVVLSGVTAPTGGNAAQNPMPLLLEVTNFAQLPNSFKANVKRCFVTANAAGDISSERVLVRLDRLSCMNKQGKAVDVRVQGYVTGEDGKAGVRARLVTRSGQAIASALFTGAISGLGRAVSLSAQSSTTYSSGAVGSTVDNPWAAGIGEGVDSAMDRIVNYYLKLADKIFPVLELDSGREVDIVLAQGLSLSFASPSPEETGAVNSSVVFGEQMRARREGS